MPVHCSIFDSVPQMSIPEWVHVLRVSDMWQMDYLRTTAISVMSPLVADESCALILRIPYDHSIDEWKYSAIARLVLQSPPLSAVDLETLGFKMAADMLHVRERGILIQIMSTGTSHGSILHLTQTARSTNFLDARLLGSLKIPSLNLTRTRMPNMPECIVAHALMFGQDLINIYFMFIYDHPLSS
jgi:hypothetical protein